MLFAPLARLGTLYYDFRCWSYISDDYLGWTRGDDSMGTGCQNIATNSLNHCSRSIDVDRFHGPDVECLTWVQRENGNRDMFAWLS
jgi:hypothetical protein